ncbi:MAG: hypothetical protein AB7F75_03795 [Planctomycetota bacterium]
MPTPFELFTLALSERVSRLWSVRLGLEVIATPCLPVRRLAVEVMVGLPATCFSGTYSLGACKGLVAADIPLLLTAVDRLLGGKGDVVEERPRPLTTLELSLALKLFTDLQGALEDLWRAFVPTVENVRLEGPESLLRKVWNPGDSIVETSFHTRLGGGSGSLRFLWPGTLVSQAFGDLELEHVEASQWSPRPWAPRLPEPVTLAPRTAPQTAVQPPIVSSEIGGNPPAKPRIAFDDFDALIASFRQG